MISDWMCALALGATFSFGLGAAAKAEDGVKDRPRDREDIHGDKVELRKDGQDPGELRRDPREQRGR